MTPASWRFRYRILSDSITSRGFVPRRGIPANPFRIVPGSRSVALVMTYADPTSRRRGNARRASEACRTTSLSRTPQKSGVRSRDVTERLKRWMFSGASSLLVTVPLQEEYARR